MPALSPLKALCIPTLCPIIASYKWSMDTLVYPLENRSNSVQLADSQIT